LVDFLEQEIAGFPDAEIGGVARVVHEGCRKALREHVELEPVREEDEGTSVTLPAGFNPAEVKLSGNVGGSAPYKGVLRHRGWRAKKATLPVPVAGHDAPGLAPGEVELGGTSLASISGPRTPRCRSRRRAPTGRARRSPPSRSSWRRAPSRRGRCCRRSSTWRTRARGSRRCRGTRIAPSPSASTRA